MKQKSLADNGFEKHRKLTRKEQFLAEMEKIIPWADLVSVVEPFYPRPEPDKAGRRPVGVEPMLRIHFIQHWFNLADPAVEDALYDMEVLRRFVGIDLGQERVPDETTICRFRHLLEKHGLGERFFQLINEYLSENGLRVHRGTIVDATIINAPSSTKNKAKERDPEMHSTRKGQQCYFGMKAHIGVDSRTRLIHSASFTAANAHDSTEVGRLLHGGETKVWGDSAYTGKREAIRAKAPAARDYTHRRGVRGHPLSDEEIAVNKTKSRVRAKVEHPFLVLKRRFGFRKVRFKGIAKNANHLRTSFALVNVVMSKEKLLRGRPPPRLGYA